MAVNDMECELMELSLEEIAAERKAVVEEISVLRAEVKTKQRWVEGLDRVTRRKQITTTGSLVQRSRRVVGAAMICFSLSGCSAGKVWTHTTKGEQAFHGDSAECEAMSYSAGSGQVLYAGGNPVLQGWNAGAVGASRSARTRIYEGCMMGKGWQPE